jgi:hypothetical protein
MPEVISMLVTAGAHVDDRDVEGTTAFNCAQHNSVLKGSEVIQQLRGGTTW